MNTFKQLVLTCFSMLLFTAATVVISSDELEPISTPTSNTPNPSATMIIIKTSKGDIEVSLDSEKAPETVKNFLSYVDSKHYNGTIFHRVIPNFMIQGGGFEPGMSQKPTQSPVVNEADNGLVNNKYTLAMARTSDPHSATSQFFINTKNNDFLNYTSSTPSGWGYAVFGIVTKGQEVVDAIETVATGSMGPYGDVPLEDVVIESIELVE